MDILSIGEPLMEFSEVKENYYTSGFGGDTSNFIIAASRQGASTVYHTAIGNDTFGRKFLELWKNENVHTNYIKVDSNHHTGLYFISYSNEGHEFTYQRKNSAASHFTSLDVTEELFSTIKFFHFSGISQAISNEACDAIDQAIYYAKKHQVVISYDPNLRLKLWPLDRARKIIHSTIKDIDIFLPSMDDVVLLSGLQDPDEIIDYYLNFGIRTIVLKMGEKGALLATPTEKIFIPPYKVDPVDATGAGDTFDGAFIARLANGDSLEKAAKYANIAAALSTQGYGAVNPIPRIATVLEAFQKNN